MNLPLEQARFIQRLHDGKPRDAFIRTVLDLGGTVHNIIDHCADGGCGDCEGCVSLELQLVDVQAGLGRLVEPNEREWAWQKRMSRGRPG